MRSILKYASIVGLINLTLLRLETHAQGNTFIEFDRDTNEVELGTVTQPGYTYELQSSTSLTDWLSITSPSTGDGTVLKVIQTLVSNTFYRFRTIEQTERFSPELFPFDMFEEFGIFIPGFDEEIVVESLEENKVSFEVEMHTDPENFVGVVGEMEYVVRPENLNTADFLITYQNYTTRNSTSGDSTERSPEQQAAATNEAQIREILITYQFVSPQSGSSTTIYRFTDGTEEMFLSEFEFE